MINSSARIRHFSKNGLMTPFFCEITQLAGANYNYYVVYANA